MAIAELPAASEEESGGKEIGFAPIPLTFSLSLSCSSYQVLGTARHARVLAAPHVAERARAELLAQPDLVPLQRMACTGAHVSFLLD